MHKEIAEKRKVVLPLLLEQVKIPPILCDKVYADFTAEEKFNESFRKLLETVDDSLVPEPADDYRATPTPGAEVRDTYRVLEGKPVRLTIFVGKAQISGIPDVRIGVVRKEPCKKTNPFVWILDEPKLHGKILHCTTYLPKTPGVSPSKIMSITYTLEGGESHKQWISQINVDDVSEFPVLFEADIYLHTN